MKPARLDSPTEIIRPFVWIWPFIWIWAVFFATGFWGYFALNPLN